MIEEDLVHWLRSRDEVADLVGDRIYPLRAPQGAALPYLTYQVISGLRVRNLTDGPCGMGNPRLQLDCWAATYAGVRALAEAVRGTKAETQLDGYTGTMNGTWVGYAEVRELTDLYEEPVHADDGGAYRATLDVLLWHDEPTA